MNPDAPEDPTTAQVRRAVAGDREGLSWIIERFGPALLAQARFRLGPELCRKLEPRDLVQEVWLIAFPRLSDLTPREDHLTSVLLRFLSTTLIHRANYHLRRFYRREEVDLAESDVDARLRGDIAESCRRLMGGELKSRLEEAMEALSEDERQVVRLRGLECWSNAEAAQLLGIEANTVAKRWSRALAHLRDQVPDSLFLDLA